MMNTVITVKGKEWSWAKQWIIILLLLELSPMMGMVCGYEFSEEFCKALAVSLSFTFAARYVIVFNIFEFSQYVVRYAEATISDGQFLDLLTIRGICIVDHFGYMCIHMVCWYISNKQATKAAKWNYRIAGFLAAWLLHYAHNEWGFKPIAYLFMN
jgi:RsiW-degrading membrane proteinase PrsW (M82 family)